MNLVAGSRFLLVLLLSLFCSLHVKAQDYQMFTAGRTAFFSDENKEIKSLRIDSASFLSGHSGSEGDLVLYPMQNIQLRTYRSDNCATPYGDSWIGGKIVVRSDGEHLFFNKFRDTIRILPNAGLNESWCAFNSEECLIEGKVTSLDTIHIFGLVDSVKTIDFQAFSSPDNPVPHEANILMLKVSKQLGVVQMLNFYQFPDYEEMAYGFMEDGIREHELVGLSYESEGGSKTNVGLQNLTWFEVFDFQPGDEIHTLLDEFDWFMEHVGSSSYRQTIRRFLTRQDYPDSLVYTYEQKVLAQEVLDSLASESFQHDTGRLVIYRNPLFDKLPGEVTIDGDWAWSHFMSRGVGICKTVPSIALGIWGMGDSCWAYCCADGCFMDEIYYKGLGGPYGYCSQSFSYGKTEKKLIYYKKGEETWGTPFKLTSTEPDVSLTELQIYPNPASDFLWIKSTTGPIQAICLLEISGRKVLDQVVNQNQLHLDLSSYSPGIYVLQVMDVHGKHASRIIIQGR